MITPPLPPSVQPATVAASALHVTGGLAFIAIWLIAAAAWAAVSLMGGLMANDAGPASSGRHGSVLFWMLAGEILVALAGIPGGLAFFMSSHRSLLLWSFPGLLLTGIALQGWAFWSFFSAASR